MPWEYHAHMRPWLQPAFYFALLQPLLAQGGYAHFVCERITLLVQLAVLTLMLPLLWPLVAPAFDGVVSRTMKWGTLSVVGWWLVPSMLMRHSPRRHGPRRDWPLPWGLENMSGRPRMGTHGQWWLVVALASLPGWRSGADSRLRHLWRHSG